jgi:hypothetical protein
VLEKLSPSSQKTLTSCESTTWSPSRPPPGTATMKLQVAVRTSAVTVLEPSCRLSPTVLVPTPAGPLRRATAPQLLAVIVRSSLTATLAVEVATVEAQPWGQYEGWWRRRSRRPRPREQPRLQSLTGRLRRPPED